MDNKLGVYICAGCSIGDTINLQPLVRIAEKDFHATCCNTHPFLCGPEGLAAIRQDLEAGAADRLLIAACSPRVKCEEFSFGPYRVMERVNLREQVVWTHPAHDEDTQAMAEDYLRMGLARAVKMEPFDHAKDGISKSILVVGGGVTGITAALEGAEAGYDTILVEKQDHLGGALANAKLALPSRPPYTVPAPCTLTQKIKRLGSNPRTTIYTSTRIRKVEGEPGRFDVTLEKGPATSRHRVGAVVMATGWKPYDATRLAHLGYGLSPNVITSVEFEALAKAGKWSRPSDGGRIQRVLFIQCAGSRDASHLPYCSATCCMETLKQVYYLQQEQPQAETYVVYRDMRTPGQYEKFYAAVQDHPTTFFVKGDIQSVRQIEGGKLSVGVSNSLFGGDFQLAVDLIVLAIGMTPNSADGEALCTLRSAQAKLQASLPDGQRAELESTVARLAGHQGTEILNLAYRQGPDLPVLTGGFPDSHFICFPYETRRTGIYAAGAVRAPMDASLAEEDARGSMLKAIQSVEFCARGEAVHPRVGDLSYPSFLLQRCTQCKRCTVECPFGAIDEDEKGTPKFNPTRCRRCGVCMGACPERIISFQNYSVDIISSMIKAIEVPEEDEEKPRILMFVCENDAYPALDAAALARVPFDASIRVIPLRCLGSLNIIWIADALSRGIDGIMMLGCEHGDDYQCHFIKGSELAARRLENVKETLSRLQLESERIQVEQVAINEYAKLPALIGSFAERLREIGANPYKGF